MKNGENFNLIMEQKYTLLTTYMNLTMTKFIHDNY